MVNGPKGTDESLWLWWGRGVRECCNVMNIGGEDNIR